MKIFYKIIILLILLLICFGHYKVLQSSELQSYIMFDYNNATFRTPVDVVMAHDKNFPNVTITTLPIKFLQARYMEEIDSLEIAKKLYFESMRENINPYLKASEGEIADLYFNQKKYDSAYYFAKQAFDVLPNSNVHRTIYFKTLRQRKDTVALEAAFNKINKFQNPSHWTNYFYDRFGIVGPGDNQILTLLKAYREKFNKQKDLGTDILEKVLLQGEEKVTMSVDVSIEAENLFNEKKYIDAAELYIIASQIEETEYTFYENAAISYNLGGQFEKANYFFDKVIYDLNPGNGKSEFYKGLMLIKLDSLNKGCSYIQKAIKLRFSESGSKEVYNNFCL